LALVEPISLGLLIIMLIVMLLIVMLLVFLATEYLATTLLAVISVPGDFKCAMGAFRVVAFGS